MGSLLLGQGVESELMLNPTPSDDPDDPLVGKPTVLSSRTGS
jgi:hypothetical protein